MRTNQIKLGKIFTVEKGNRKMRWKVIEHPYFPGQLTLVRDYCGMTNYTKKEDELHVNGCVTLENAYNVAYSLT